MAKKAPVRRSRGLYLVFIDVPYEGPSHVSVCPDKQTALDLSAATPGSSWAGPFPVGDGVFRELIEEGRPLKR